MPQTCSICNHQQRKEIEQSVTRGVSLRHIGSQFSVGYKAVERHAKKCIAPVVQQAKIEQERSTVASVKEILELLTRQARADITDLYDDNGGFDIKDIRDRGLGPMLKAITFKQEKRGEVVEDVVKVEAYSAQGAAQALLNAYTKLEIAKQVINAKFTTDIERSDRIAALFERARDRRAGRASGDA